MLNLLINDALNNGFFPEVLAKAHMVLIPKGESPEVIQNFRPITLLNVSYKALSKVIVNRIHPLLEDLIGPFHSSFLPGRSTTANIILTKEAIHSVNKLKGRLGAMILKVDFHKAFDSISWTFLREVLEHFNFPPILINLIIYCVSSNSLSILWNGKQLPSFKPGRGLRQGDPISPYLFILVMEKLSHMIQNEVHKGNWMPFILSRGVCN